MSSGRFTKCFPMVPVMLWKTGDFESTSGALVFADRDPSKDLLLTVSSDDLAEYGEFFEVVLENVTGKFATHIMTYDYVLS